MSVTTFQCVVENGQIRLPTNVRLPEKATVYVVVPNLEMVSFAYIGSPRLVHPEQALDFQKEVSEELSQSTTPCLKTGACENEPTLTRSQPS
jgi:hypothetical protein